jgi:hypothetical protein
MRDALCGLVEDLSEYADATPDPARADDGAAAPPLAERAVPRTPAVTRNAPPAEDLPDIWRGADAVLCLGGRSPLDDAAAAMLAQLLRMHGVGARFERHESVARQAIGALDLEGVACICVSYLEETGSAAHLRFLLRRLRQRAPHAHLMAALWTSQPDPEWQNLGADSTAATLRQALSRCLDAAYEAVRGQKAA